eukprot:m.15014 g.15014  ORF g.15014 m.15014 type:complete len:62 (+) comp5265_c0_seq2:745-930(+)
MSCPSFVSAERGSGMCGFVATGENLAMSVHSIFMISQTCPGSSNSSNTGAAILLNIEYACN